MNLADVQTPALVLDRAKLQANVDRMNACLSDSGVRLRPHLKTAKSIDVARVALQGREGSITVSTVREAEYFFSQGVTDILYAVAIAPAKLPRIAELIKQGASVQLVLDSLWMAIEVAERGRQLSVEFPVLIEIDCDGHRSGLQPEDDAVLEVAKFLHDAMGAEFHGVLTHAGESYECESEACIAELAEQERVSVVRAAKRLHAERLPCPTVSVGSSPTVSLAADYSGLTEVRAGVYMFQDLFQSNLGVCRVDDVAVSVLCTVIGHQPSRNLLITDAGALALSKDCGTARQRIDYRYGLVCGAESGKPIGDYLVTAVNQEHGLISRLDGQVDSSRFPLGSQLRILPNHACLTAACFDRYHVLDQRGLIEAVWPRIRGW